MELHQLLKVMGMITELTREKMEKTYATRNLTHESFLKLRYDLYSAQKWQEYEELLKWELAE